MNRFRVLIGILIISVVATLALPVFTTRYIHPAFDGLLTRLTEEEAIRLATHLASSLSPEDDPFRKESFLPRFGETIDTFRRDINLVKIKMFSQDGEIIYSTDRSEIGKINRKKYFHEIVALGSPFTKVVRKEAKTLEDKVMMTDVVETYVPIVMDGRFAGAFEVYYDISKSKERLDHLIRRSTYAVFAVTFGLLVAVFFSSGGAYRSIRERNRIEEALFESERKYRDLYDNAPDMYQSIDRNGILVECNETGTKMLGYSREEVIGKPIQGILSDRSAANFGKNLPAFRKKEVHLNLELEFIRKDGTRFPAGVSAFSEFDREGRFLRIKAIAQDITDRKQMEKALRELAETDPLTRPTSVIMFDLDHFKQVNDTYGHQTGDSVLVAVADLVRKAIRGPDILSRYGGEEFLVLCPETDLPGARSLAERIRKVTEEHLHDRAGRVTVSLGACLFRDEEDGATLLRRVDEALYAAKEKGRNRVEIEE
jgi:diguanylate cyclase (GGDEF)-like protein